MRQGQRQSRTDAAHDGCERQNDTRLSNEMCSANPNCANHKDKQRQIESTQRLFLRRSQAGRCNQMQPATSRTDRGPRGIDGTNQSRRIQTDKIGRCNAGARKRHPLLTFASVDRTLYSCWVVCLACGLRFISSAGNALCFLRRLFLTPLKYRAIFTRT